jgi:hypothetical protein
LEESLSLVVFLTVPAEIRVARLGERELRRFGRVDPAFFAWAAQYDEGRLDGRSLVGSDAIEEIGGSKWPCVQVITPTAAHSLEHIEDRLDELQ